MTIALAIPMATLYTYPVWAPDGKHILFRTASSSGVSLNWLRSDGAGELQKLLESKSDARPYSFSPDGKRLLFADLSADGHSSLWTLPLDMSDPEHPKSGRPELFLKTNADVFESAFSSDGRWVAYRSNSPSGIEVYVQPFPGPGGKWLIGPGRFPMWSRNGKELFYLGLDDRIMVTSYRASGDSFYPDKPRVWSEVPTLQVNGAYSNLDLEPGGKRFVASPRPEAMDEQKGAVRITVLLNFFDELRRRIPGK